MLDIRNGRADRQYPIYAINSASLNWDEAIQYAPDFSGFLLKHYSHLDLSNEGV